MTLFNLLSKLNWRLIIMHIIACWFLMHSFAEFYYLYNYGFAEKIINHNYKVIDNIEGIDFGSRVAIFVYWMQVCKLIGLLTGLVISLLMLLKNKWYWVNSVIVLVGVLVALIFDTFIWSYLRCIFLKPGLLFKPDWVQFVVNGLVMLVPGLLIFFLNASVRFINVSYHAKSE